MSSENLVNYKDVMIPSSLSEVIPYMKNVENYREELRVLSSQWDLLTILGQISGTGTDMTSTREGFKMLTSELLGHLGLENLKKISQDMTAKAQVAVDIVIRNLFERTADIGFLATDDDIRKFITETKRLSAMSSDKADEQGINKTEYREELLRSIRERFVEYTKKYSVYDNIILLDTSGNVLAQMDETSTVTKSSDPVIQEALSTNEEYVEIFRETDLLPGRGDCLIYAFRVTESISEDSKKLGVLCLCFRFENEMEGVFANLHSENDWTVITLLDKSGKVIASSDRHQVPLGAKMEKALSSRQRLIKFAGRQYLAKTCETKGYQGFFGLGWLGHVMIPVQYAFDTKSQVKSFDAEILEAVMKDPKLFSGELRNIPLQADRIQGELERTVWNGNIIGTDPKSKILLWNISDAGAKTKNVFENSIGNLHETVIESVLENVHFFASLSVDVMDRNLYERANDSRWWALTSYFRETLAKGSVTQEEAEEITNILKYINGLYTVYTNLLVFDKKGEVIAVSNPSESYLTGTVLSESWVRETLGITDSQQYTVSDFVKTPLYGDRYTYIYGASITSPENSSDVVGGIGIVFDSEPQFFSMLEDSLPKNDKGETPEGCFAMYVDRKGKIISSSSTAYTAGNSLEIDKDLLGLKNGEGTSRIIQHNCKYYAVGAFASSGYREYKTCDGYSNDITGLIFVELADVNSAECRSYKKREMKIDVRSHSDRKDCIEVATFFIDDKWLGIRSCHIRESVKPHNVVTLPGSPIFVKGQMIYGGKPTVLVDIRPILGLPTKPLSMDSQIIIIKTEKTNIGLIADALAEIPEIDLSRVDEPDKVMDKTRYTDCIIKPENGRDDQEMLLVLHPDGLLECIKELM